MRVPARGGSPPGELASPASLLPAPNIGRGAMCCPSRWRERRRFCARYERMVSLSHMPSLWLRVPWKLWSRRNRATFRSKLDRVSPGAR
eukprot:9488319-Pyramimonas_sp.AAC.1